MMNKRYEVSLKGDQLAPKFKQKVKSKQASYAYARRISNSTVTAPDMSLFVHRMEPTEEPVMSEHLGKSRLI